MIDINLIFTGSAVIISALLVINYVFLIKKYNKNKILPIKTTSEKELMEKYGGVLSACIIEKRGYLPRDIIAIIIKLIQNDIIDIKSKRVTQNGKIVNCYTLTYINKDEKLNEIDKKVIDILFKDDDKCILNTTLNNKNKFEEVKKKINENLKSIGANGIKVPKKTQIMNTVFFALVCIFVILHLIYNFDSKISFTSIINNLKYWFVMLIKIDALFILSISLIKILSMLNERLKSKNNFYKIEFSDKLLINIFFNFFISNMIMLVFLSFVGSNLYFIPDIILFDFAMILMVTDELLVSHSPRMNKDYISLKKFESTLKSNGIFDNFTPDNALMLKSYIPLVISLNNKDISAIEYIQKMIDISLDEDEIKKYKIIKDIFKLREPEIRKIYYDT